MSQEHFQGLLKQVNNLTQQEKNLLAKSLLEEMPKENLEAKSDKVNSIDNARTKEFNWLAQNKHKYLGQYVALNGDELLCYGTNGREVIKKARSLGVKNPLIVHIEEDEDLPFGLQW